ncbi:unnamed protein product, partial [Laminaria digitata]
MGGDGHEEPAILVLDTLRIRLGMSNDGARAAFVAAFYEVAAPKIKQTSLAIETLKDAREVMPSPSPSINTPPPPVAAVSGGSKGKRDATNGSPTLSATPPSGAVVVAPGRGEAGTAAEAVSGSAMVL